LPLHISPTPLAPHPSRNRHSLAQRYKIKYHIPAHAKLLCPLGKLLNPSWSRSILVHASHDVRPWTGLDVSSSGRSHRPNRSGRGRPTVTYYVSSNT
jgi:hypothetical protein